MVAVPNLAGLFDDLVRFETLLWSRVDERLRQECDLTLGALNVLLVVEATTACRVLDVAHALAITVGGVSQAVDRLASAGSIVRVPNPADRRSSILQLTDQGAAELARARPVFERALGELLVDPLSPTRLIQLAEILHALRDAAGRHRGEPDG